MAKGVEFITQTFDEYEKDSIIVTLQNGLKSASMKAEDLWGKKIERQEQYSKRNFILIHGLKVEKNESTDDRVVKSFREGLNENV